MKKMNFPNSRGWIFTVHLLPFIFGMLLFLFGCIPHFYFIMDGEIYEDMSFFGILSNTLSTCFSFFNGTANGSVAELYFSYIMAAISAVCILLLIWYAGYLFFTAVLTICTVTYSPKSQKLNRIKRYYKLLNPNRVATAIYQLFPLLSAFFPYLLQLFYRTKLGLSAKLCFYLLPDPFWVLLFALISTALAFWSKPSAKQSHLDLFTLYKS